MITGEPYWPLKNSALCIFVVCQNASYLRIVLFWVVLAVRIVQRMYVSRSSRSSWESRSVVSDARENVESSFWGQPASSRFAAIHATLCTTPFVVLACRSCALSWNLGLRAAGIARECSMFVFALVFIAKRACLVMSILFGLPDQLLIELRLLAMELVVYAYNKIYMT